MFWMICSTTLRHSNAYKHEQQKKKRGGDEDAHRRALHCIRAKLTNGSCFSVLFFFSSSWLKQISGSPLSWETNVPVLQPLFRFPPSFCRVILAVGETGPVSQIYLRRSAANISPHLSECLFLSHSLPLAHWHLPDHFLPFSPLPIFCFSVWPSRGAHNLPVSSGCFSPSEEGMSKGSSLSIQDHYGLLFLFFFFVIPAEYEESQKTKFTERHCAIRGWGQIQCVPYRLKVLPQATLLWSISIDVSHGSSIAEWWDPVQGVSCSAFFSFFFFLLLLESGCG